MVKNGEILVLSHIVLFGVADCVGVDMEITIIILIVLIIVLSSAMLYREFQHVSRRVSGLEERVVKLESANRKRMPYEAFEMILNARAALNKEKSEFQFFNSLIENAESWLDKAVEIGTKREEK